MTQAQKSQYGKNTNGRQRHLLVDGLMTRAVVHTTGIVDPSGVRLFVWWPASIRDFSPYGPRVCVDRDDCGEIIEWKDPAGVDRRGSKAIIVAGPLRPVMDV